VVVVDTAAGRLQALVLDVGSPDRRLEAGRRVRVLFKETSLVVAAPHHPAFAGRLDSLRRGKVVVEFGAVLRDGRRLEGVLPPEEFPADLAVGDGIRLYVPASAVALELP